MRHRDLHDPKTAIAGVFLVCHSCGTRVHTADRFCRRCGLALLQPDTPGSDPPGADAHGADAQNRRSQARLSPSRLRALLGVAAAVVFVASLATTLPLPGKQVAEMAGIRIGDSASKVEQVLGTPQRSPVPLAWKPHHEVLMWQYDLDFEAGGIPNLSVTFVDGRVWRVASLHERYATRGGLRVGDDLAKARRLYGTGIEEDPDGGLVPWKFVCDGQVVKVIVEEGGQELLAVGIETPFNFKLVAPPSWLQEDDQPEPALPEDAPPGDRDRGGDRRVL